MKSAFGDDVLGFDDFPRWGNHMWEPKGDPDPGEVCGNFVQTNLAFFCGRKQGRREMLAATFLGPACLPQRHFSSLLDRKKRFFRGCFGFVSEGASFPGWAKRLQFHQGCFVFFTGGSGWQMNEMMQKASAF